MGAPNKLFDLTGQAVLEKKDVWITLINGHIQMDDGRTPDHDYNVSPPGEPVAQMSK